MPATVVGGAVVEITADLSKFSSEAKTQLTEALNNSSVRNAITDGLDAAAVGATESGQTAAGRFAEGVSAGSGTLAEAGTRAGQALTDGLSVGADGSTAALASAGAEAGAAFTDSVTDAAAGAGDALEASVGTDSELAASYDAAGADAGSAFSDAVVTSIDAGASDVADAASDQADGVDDAGGNALAEAGASVGDAFTDSVKEQMGGLSAKAAPIAVAEAAKVGTESGAALASAGAEAGSRFGEGLTESIKGLASSLGPIVGVLGAGELVKSSLEAADAVEGANIKIENVFGESGDAVEKWAQGVTGSLRQSTLQAETAAGQFGAYLSGLGVGKQQAAGLSEQLVTLSGNIAAFNNADPATVQAALTSALRGRTTALKQYGVTLTDAQIQQEALTHANELGLTVTNGTVPALNTQQKALATLYAVMDATKNQQGALAKTSDTVKAKEQEATAEFANLRVELGQQLIPILAVVLGVLTNDIIPALVDTGHWISQNSAWLKPLVIVIGTAALAYKAWAIGTGLVKAATAGLSTVMRLFAGDQARAAIANEAYNAALAEGKTEAEAAAIAQGELDGAMDANPIGLVVAAIAALAAGFYYAYTHSKTFRDIVNDVGSALKTVWTTVLQPVVDFFMNNWKTALEVALAVFLPFIGIPLLIYKYWGDIESFFAGLWRDVLRLFGDVVTFLRGPWGTAILTAVAVFMPFIALPALIALHWRAVVAFFEGIWKDITGAFTGAVTWLVQIGKDLIDGLWSGIQFAWQVLYTWFVGWPLMIVGYFVGALQWLAQAGQDIINGLVGGIHSIWDKEVTGWENIETTVKGWFTGAIGWLSQAGSDMVTGLFTGIGSAITAAGGAVSSMASNIASGIRTGLDNVLGLPWKIPRIELPTSPFTTVGFGPWTLIPKLAAGGMTRGPGQFVMGDNPSGQEVALPLDSPATTTALSIALSKANDNGPATKFSGSDSGPQTVTLDADSITAIIQALESRPVNMVVGNKVIAKASNTGNKALARIR